MASTRNSGGLTPSAHRNCSGCTREGTANTIQLSSPVDSWVPIGERRPVALDPLDIFNPGKIFPS